MSYEKKIPHATGGLAIVKRNGSLYYIIIAADRNALERELLVLAEEQP
jgi:hypothetical protein